MRPRDWFLVGVRLIGVWIFYQGASHLVSYAALMMNSGARMAGMPQYGPAQIFGEYYLVSVCGDIAFGAFLIFGCEKLARRLFPDSRQPAEIEQPQPAGDVDRLHQLLAEEMARKSETGA